MLNESDLDKSNLICVGPAQDLFCDLELYADSHNIVVILVLFKRIVLKKWIVPKEGIAVAWSGHTHGAPSDYRCNSYIGFLLLNGDLIKIPMMQIGNDKFTDPKYQLGARKLYRGGLIWYHKNVDFTDGPRYLGIIPRERVI